MGSIFTQMVISQTILNIFNWLSTFGHYLYALSENEEKKREILKLDF